jgi:hypothetical protein
VTKKTHLCQEMKPNLGLSESHDSKALVEPTL